MIEALILALEALETCTTWNLTREQFDRNFTAINVIKKVLEQLKQDCARSHPHENMDALCKLKTEIARLTNENARLKANSIKEQA